MNKERKENLKKCIAYKEKLIKEYAEFQKILEQAIDQFIKNKFKRLLNALKKYGTPNRSLEQQFEEVRDCWGNDIISDKTFEKIKQEWEEYCVYSVARCVDECLFLFDRKISQNERELHELKKEYDFLK